MSWQHHGDGFAQTVEFRWFELPWRSCTVAVMLSFTNLVRTTPLRLRSLCKNRSSSWCNIPWRWMQETPRMYVWKQGVFICNSTLQWRHNGRDGVSNHQPRDCSLNRLSNVNSLFLVSQRYVRGSKLKCVNMLLVQWWPNSLWWFTWYRGALFLLWFRVHWNLFPIVQFTIGHHWFRYWLVASKMSLRLLWWPPTEFTIWINL